MTLRSLARRPLLAMLAAGVAAALLGASPARCQILQPWAPAGDSLLRDVATARLRFQRQAGDSVSGDNYAAFETVGQIGRRLMRSLGREHVLQAPAIEVTLDSLGLDTEVAVDPMYPGIVLLLVRNPFRVSSDAVGFLFWFRQTDLRMQGASYPPCRDVRLRAWWTSRPETPYEAGVLYVVKGQQTFHPGFKLFRMNQDGYFWNLVQYDGHGPEFGDRAQATFADVNNDGTPELLAFNPVDPDTFFALRTGAPPLVNEFIYTERPEGYVLHDARTIPGPVETLRVFATMMTDREFERAKRIMMKPERMPDAIANGWAGLRGRDAWVVEYGEPQQPWPEWLAVRTTTAAGVRRWIFHFYIRDGRWVIRDWVPVQEKLPRGVSIPGLAPADSTARKR